MNNDVRQLKDFQLFFYFLLLLLFSFSRLHHRVSLALFPFILSCTCLTHSCDKEKKNAARIATEKRTENLQEKKKIHVNTVISRFSEILLHKMKYIGYILWF